MWDMKGNKQLHFGVKNYKMEIFMFLKQEEISLSPKTINFLKHSNTTNTIKIDKYITILQFFN